MTGRRIYRTMLAEPDGGPRLGPNAFMRLGVRIVGEHRGRADVGRESDGSVMPTRDGKPQGASGFVGDWRKMPAPILPSPDGSAHPDAVVYSIDEGELPAGLHVPPGRGHVVVAPASAMPMADYIALLESTRAHWRPT